MAHLRQLPSGKWRALVKHAGQAKWTRAVDRKADASRLAAELLLEMGGTPTESPTVGELIDAHLAAAELSPTTRADYLSVADRLPDEFRQRRVRDVKPAVIEGLYAQLARGGLSAHRIGRLHELLSVAWHRAVRYEWADRNPLTNVQRPRVDTHEIVPPTPAQVAALIATAPAGFGDYLRLAASTGARRGELIALQWVDVRFDQAEVVIRRSLAYTPASGVVLRETKTGRIGHRVINIGLPVLAALRRLHARQAELALSERLTARWVFSSTAGHEPWHPDYPTTAFDRTRKTAGITGVRLHDLRHFVATQMLGDGHSVAQVAARLGQTQQATTARYSHWIPARDRDAAERLEALVAESPPSG